MKDAIGPTMAVGGGSLTLTPSVIIQIVGAIVGVVGVILTFMKLREDKLSRLERKRANDIAQERLNLDRELINAKAENDPSTKA